MASRTDGLNVTTGGSERPGVTVTDPRFPTTLVHVRDSIEEMAEAGLPDGQVYVDEGQAVRIQTPVRVRGRVVHRGGDVTYALRPAGHEGLVRLRLPDDAGPVLTWSARSGSPVLVPARQVAWL